MKDKDPRLISREIAMQGSVIDYYHDTVELPDGGTENWDFISHKKGGGSAAVPVLDDGRIIMIRQFRPSVGREYLELPAGARDKMEDPADTAARELLEETGYRAGRISHLITVDTAPAFCDELTRIYLAEDLTYEGGGKLDPAENIKVVIMEAEELREALMKGEIRDSKTACGLMCYFLKKCKKI